MKRAAVIALSTLSLVGILATTVIVLSKKEKQD